MIEMQELPRAQRPASYTLRAACLAELPNSSPADKGRRLRGRRSWFAPFATVAGARRSSRRPKLRLRRPRFAKLYPGVFFSAR